MKRAAASIVLLLTLLAAACAPHQTAAEAQKEIVGKWTNEHGYTIEYRADGTGFIPAADDIGDTPFTYFFSDDDHLSMVVGGQSLVVQVKVDGDKLTWLDQRSGTNFIYTRVK